VTAVFLAYSGLVAPALKYVAIRVFPRAFDRRYPTEKCTRNGRFDLSSDGATSARGLAGRPQYPSFRRRAVGQCPPETPFRSVQNRKAGGRVRRNPAPCPRWRSRVRPPAGGQPSSWYRGIEPVRARCGGREDSQVSACPPAVASLVAETDGTAPGASRCPGSAYRGPTASLTGPARRSP